GRGIAGVPTVPWRSRLGLLPLLLLPARSSNGGPPLAKSIICPSPRPAKAKKKRELCVRFPGVAGNGSWEALRREPMADFPLTRASLLIRLRDPQDEGAWTEFVDLYAPLVYGYARKQGLQDADAADLTQDVLGAVAGAVDRLEYDPARG